MKILVIEDDAQIIEALRLAFQIRWPEAQIVSTTLGEDGVEMVETQAPDVVILDLGLPDISGFEALKRIRLFSQVPVLILSVRAEEPDIVKGLEWGADDYVVKPFRQLELLSRVKALLRKQGPKGSTQMVQYGKFRLNPETSQLFADDKEIKMTVTEARMLHHLMMNAGQVVTHSNLAEAVWGNDYPDAADSLKVYVRRIRQKIEDDPANPQLILTRAGVGYTMPKPS